MSAALFFRLGFTLVYLCEKPLRRDLATGVSVCLRTEGPAAGLFEAAHHRQIVAGVARAEVEPLREVEPEPAVLEPETRIERL